MPDQVERSGRGIEMRYHILLLLLWVSGSTEQRFEPIQALTKIMKLLFLIGKETNVHNWVSSFYDFKAYKLGPFDKTVYRDIEALVDRDLVNELALPTSLGSAGRAVNLMRTGHASTYYLTENGRAFTQRLIEAALASGQFDLIESVKQIKHRYNHMSLDDLLTYVYSNYEEYAEQSEVRKRHLK